MICQRCAKEKSGIHTCTPSDLVRGLEQQNAELVAALECAESLFDRTWNSVVGSGCEFNWQPVGNWRHYTCKMTGETFIEALSKVKQP